MALPFFSSNIAGNAAPKRISLSKLKRAVATRIRLARAICSS